MTEFNKTGKWDWICRIFFSLAVISMLRGYISYLQTKQQLVSPLIPSTVTDQIITDSHVFEGSLMAGILLLAGFWFFSFNRKKTAALFFGVAIILQQLVIYFF